MGSQSTAAPSLSIEPLQISAIYASPHQMRKHFDKEALRDLANSMKQEGLIQPITVRKVGSAYELVVGERRLRAAQLLGWETIDARIIDISDEDAAVKGLIENLQRADLSAVEEAKGYKQLVDHPYNLTQDAIAQRVGKSQTAIARALALLDLPVEIQELMRRGIITETHTRSFRKIQDHAQQIEIAKRADRQGWTVKETERQVGEFLKQAGEPPKTRTRKSKQTLSDPLARLWQPILQTADDVGVKVSAVQYEGEAQWTLRVDAKGAADPRQALANFFMRLSHTLSGPVPADLLESPQTSNPTR